MVMNQKDKDIDIDFLKVLISLQQLLNEVTEEANDSFEGTDFDFME